MQSWTRTFAVLLASIIGSAVSSADGQTATDGSTQVAAKRERVKELRKKLIGWYEADEGRRLTILPKERTLVAVFDWANGAPTSVGEVVVTRSGTAKFKQPSSSESMGIEKNGGQIEAIDVVDVRFTKLAGLKQALGKYVNESGQTMEVALRNGDVYCSIDWRNNAPKTNGWLRAAPNGTTILEGYKWQEEVSLEFDENSVGAILIVGKKFNRARGPATGPAAAESK